MKGLMMGASNSWEKIHVSGAWDTQTDYPSSNQLAFIRHHVNLDANNNAQEFLLLDVGCGSGGSSIIFNQIGCIVHAIDISNSAIEAAKKKASQLGSDSINFVVGNFKKLPYESNMFDAVFAQGSLYYGSSVDFRDAVLEIYRVLRPGGCVRIYTKSSNDVWAKKGISRGDESYLIDSDTYENGLVVYCPKLENIKDVFSLFSNVKIGIEEFNYVSLDENNIHSFWLVTAIK